MGRQRENNNKHSNDVLQTNHHLNKKHTKNLRDRTTATARLIREGEVGRREREEEEGWVGWSVGSGERGEGEGGEKEGRLLGGWGGREEGGREGGWGGVEW